MMMSKFGGAMQMSAMDGAVPDAGTSRRKLFKSSQSRSKVVRKSVNVATSLASEEKVADPSNTDNTTEFKARTNLAETAFFIPQLRSDEEV